MTVCLKSARVPSVVSGLCSSFDFCLRVTKMSSSVLSIQAVHDCSSLPARQSSTLFGRPHHAVCCSDRQSRPQIRHVWLCRRTTSSLGDHLFAVAALCTWNNLSSPLHRVHSVVTFKRQLKNLSLPGHFSFFNFSAFSSNCILLVALIMFCALTSL